MISCGPLLKKEGVIKIPPAANYLDGDTVTFSCKPKYFLHGDAVRTCINGTWTPGWWVWCRDRNLEYVLKWMTALLSIFGIVLVFTIFFCILWHIRRRKEAEAIEAGKVRKYGNNKGTFSPNGQRRSTPRTSSSLNGRSRRVSQIPLSNQFVREQAGLGPAAMPMKRPSSTRSTYSTDRNGLRVSENMIQLGSDCLLQRNFLVYSLYLRYLTSRPLR